MRLDGKVALVTGAARGIGRGCALELARAGADVSVNDLASVDDAIAEIREFGRRAEPVTGDAFDRASCESIVARTLEAFGRIDVLVSNPAFSRRSPFLDYDPAMFEQVLRGTLVGGFHMAQLVARHMVERGGGGKIVLISSVHAEVPYVNSVAYNAGKVGLNHLAMTAAAELAKHRINVNVIEPGWIDTPGERLTFGDDAVETGGAGLPWGRLGTPADVGKAAAFLCSADADYVTGATLLVDGGFRLRGAGA